MTGQGFQHRQRALLGALDLNSTTRLHRLEVFKPHLWCTLTTTRARQTSNAEAQSLAGSGLAGLAVDGQNRSASRGSSHGANFRAFDQLLGAQRPWPATPSPWCGNAGARHWEAHSQNLSCCVVQPEFPKRWIGCARLRLPVLPRSSAVSTLMVPWTCMCLVSMHVELP